MSAAAMQPAVSLLLKEADLVLPGCVRPATPTGSGPPIFDCASTLTAFEDWMDAHLNHFLSPHQIEVLERHLPKFVDMLASSAHADLDEAADGSQRSAETDRVGRFFLKLAQYVVAQLQVRVEAPLPPQILRYMRILAIAESASECFFFNTYGAMLPTNASAREYEGWAARLPRPSGCSTYFCRVLNVVHTSGGFDALLRRLHFQLQDVREKRLAVGLATAAATAGPGADAATDASMAAAGAAASPVPALSVFDSEDCFSELLTYVDFLYVPRACYTYHWAARYYVPFRDALCQRVLLMEPTHLRRFVAERGFVAPVTSAVRPTHMPAGGRAALMESRLRELAAWLCAKGKGSGWRDVPDDSGLDPSEYDLFAPVGCSVDDFVTCAEALERWALAVGGKLCK